MKETNEKNIRTLTVYHHRTQKKYETDGVTPQIRLCGQWLKNAGFEIGDSIKIIVKNKCLLIVPDEDIQEHL